MPTTTSPEKRLLQHPVALFVHLVLLGIVLLFGGLVVAYLSGMQTPGWEDFRLPRSFWLSSLMVVLISWYLRKTIAAFEMESGKLLVQRLLAASFFSLVFIISQWTGWKDLQAQGITLADTPAAGYVYVISGLHALHVGVGIVLLVVAIRRAWKYVADPATALFFFTDNNRKMRLRLLAHYWHTIDYLWLFLFLAFLYRHA
ncbi:MAG: hypothetical protein ABR94_01370 [Sphingobacteriales bacterium BACL12 MAG-120802-bin5]|jgi:cytochrome c oxidase subunit III|nr:MAG: hypothetical protein ABR94_01370 [Sphingobacteriales bacterium BACL12 MAG-120802-bin5]